MHCRYSGLNPSPIIDLGPDALPRSQVLLGGLNRDMAEEWLDLIKLTARIPTEARAGSSQIVFQNPGNTTIRKVGLNCSRRSVCACKQAWTVYRIEIGVQIGYSSGHINLAGLRQTSDNASSQ